MTLRLFEGYGIELEYMVVDAHTLAVRPLVDELMRHFAGSYVGDHDDGAISWSNELAAHVVELKTTGTVPSFAGVAGEFACSLGRLAAAAAGLGARLMPGGMHPTMDPQREFVRWRHDSADIYAAYDRIFDCRGHGWSNLQSCHLNLPFADDDEFGRLHLAVRALLPLLPALSASSPFCEGRFTGWLDHRLDVYRHNQDRVPEIAGLVVPEPVTSRQEYHDVILRPIWAAIAPFDRDHLLQQEWLNSRGAVAKFFRDAVEIRVLDCQESPFADLAVCALVVEVLKQLTAERWASKAQLKQLDTQELSALLFAVAKGGDRTVIGHRGLLRVLGCDEPLTAGEIWRLLADRVLPGAPLPPELQGPLQVILQHGPLARRMLDAVGETPDLDALHGLSGQLADCLADPAGRMFVQRRT